MIEYKKLVHEDYEDIVDMSKKIWDGTDYLPKVFHKWVDDRGIFIGAVDTERNKVIAAARLTVLHDGTGWLEGLRVHVDYRGQKLGKGITEILLNQAKKELAEGRIKKVAFATHITSIESRSMMEKLDFSVVQTHVLAIKRFSQLDPSLNAADFKMEPWDVSFEDFKNHLYLKKREGLLPLAFVFQEVNPDLYSQLREEHSLIKINGHVGVFKDKGEPHFLAFEDTFEAINTYMNYYLMKYMDERLEEVYTPVLSEDKALIEKLESCGFYSWSNWEPDYLYYVLKC
ncbi:MAG: GNAT family N-acetyltransferase [Bacillota bacterium]|nr:GNAT family N-acetyltransferase [Bacillota bacterium]